MTVSFQSNLVPLRIVMRALLGLSFLCSLLAVTAARAGEPRASDAGPPPQFGSVVGVPPIWPRAVGPDGGFVQPKAAAAPDAGAAASIKW